MADELPSHPINQPPVPSDYFSQLPDEVIDLIFMYCNRSTAHPENNVFVRYEYIMQEPIRALYHEYAGDMSAGLPCGRGTMYSGSRYIDIEPPAYIGTFLKPRVSTEWLYKPLLYITTDYKLRYAPPD